MYDKEQTKKIAKRIQNVILGKDKLTPEEEITYQRCLEASRKAKNK